MDSESMRVRRGRMTFPSRETAADEETMEGGCGVGPLRREASPTNGPIEEHYFIAPNTIQRKYIL